jgi:rubrerythrin
MENESTIRNLLAAYRGEMNTQARYRAFASRADDDRLFGVPSLFRAAARSEQIHANNQARAIRQLGGEATVAIERPMVRGTLENLKDALDGENYEISTMYPRFIEEARARINATAARSFEWALEAERTHARLYAEAIALLKANNRTSWIGEARDFYVCPVCAGTAAHKNSENCTICNYPSDRLEAIR